MSLLWQLIVASPFLALKVSVHAWSAARLAGFIERHLFKFDSGEVLGHEGSSAFLTGNRKKKAPVATAQGTSELDSLTGRALHNSAYTL
jgi:hypothetical protein